MPASIGMLREWLMKNATLVITAVALALPVATSAQGVGAIGQGEWFWCASVFSTDGGATGLATLTSINRKPGLFSESRTAQNWERQYPTSERGGAAQVSFCRFFYDKQVAIDALDQWRSDAEARGYGIESDRIRQMR